MFQVCRRCHHPFEPMRRRLRPVCTACLMLPDPIPNFPPRWPYHGDSEPAWVRRLLEPRLLGQPKLAVLQPAPAVKPELSCRDCGSPITRRPGSGAQHQRCVACRPPARSPAPTLENPTFHQGRSCADCSEPLRDPRGKGRPPKRCADCRSAPSRPGVKVEVVPVPVYADLGKWLQVRLPW